MRPIASPVKVFVNRGIDERDCPGLPDEHPQLPMCLGPKAVHATIKIREPKIVVVQKLHDSGLTPVSAAPGPVQQNRCPNAMTMFSSDLELFPKLPVQIDVVLHTSSKTDSTNT